MLRDEQGNYAGQGTARRTYYMLHTAGSHFEALKALGKVEPIDGWSSSEVRGLDFADGAIVGSMTWRFCCLTFSSSTRLVSRLEMGFVCCSCSTTSSTLFMILENGVLNSGRISQLDLATPKIPSNASKSPLQQAGEA